MINNPNILSAVMDLRRANLAIKQAKEMLMFELPENVASEIHFYGMKANVSQDYAEIVKLLTEKN